MKNRTKLPNIYIGVVTAVLYLPIVLVIIYSFNESKISSVWGGFSLKWYETLFRDAAMFEALGNSIVLALCASLGAAVIGTGRSDFPNQINNVLVFPGIFKGALMVRATDITEGMKVRAARALAALIPEEQLSPDYIIPSVLDKSVADAVAKAVADEAREQGIARIG